jgi:transposase
VSKQYPRDFLGASGSLTDIRPDRDTESSAIGQVATRSGVEPETLRKWVHQAEVNAGLRQGVSEFENAKIRRLNKEVTELHRVNEILRKLSVFSRRSSNDPRHNDPIPRFVS